MSKILLIVLFAMCSLHAWPQAIPYSQVKGRIKDQETQQPLAGATVALVHAKDSSHAATAFTDKNGAFILGAVPSGRYQLYITYLGYQQQLKAITVTDTLLDLGSIGLQKSGVTLGMVEIVEVRAPMVVKKDTLEFNAGYYKPRENAVMEELLKKLPGVEIAADGTIKVNGETVKNILVDGKPFFGDDPKLATRNLPADMIDKVQLIDRKSDQAQFMGMEDAQRDKEINVILKEKNDQFLGSMAAGAGTEGRFAGNLSINRFGEGEQVSFLGGANNVNNTGFLQGTGQGIGVNGITRSWNGGVNYNKDLSDELKVSASYMTNSNRTENEQTSTRQNLLPDTTYYYNQQSVRVTSQTNHIIDMRTEYRPDTLHYLMVTGSLNFMSTDNLQQDIYESSDGEHRLVNSGQLFNNNTAKAPNAGASIFFGKQFKKKGRKLGANFYFMNNVNRQEGYNRSNNLFIEPVGEPGRDTVNQLNEQDSRHRLVQLSVTYSEPLFKNYFLDFFYAQIRNYTTTGKLTRDFNEAKRAYDQLNDSLSNTFENSITFHLGNISLRTKKRRYDYTIGWNIVRSELVNKDVTKQASFTKKVFHFFPTAFFNYAFTGSRRLRFSYNGNPQQPAVEQLQPVPDNSNPLYIREGNPDLKISFAHNFSLQYNAVNAATLRSLNVNTMATVVKNKLVNMNWFDSLGRQVSKPVNVNGAYNISTNIVNVVPLKKLQTAINVHSTVNVEKDFSYINGTKNAIKTLGLIQGLSFNYTYKTFFDMRLSGSVNYNSVRYTVQPGNNASYCSYSASFDTNLNLPLGLVMGGNLDYLLNAGRTMEYNQNVLQFNAYFAKSLFANKQCLLKVQAFNLLNQNASISRNIGESYIEDVQATVLQRFFMLSFSWFLKQATANK